jgi:glycosyltransferase involved in cell wall biosynthesis
LFHIDLPGGRSLLRTRGKTSVSVTIIIKALNEERHIAQAIESALAALPTDDQRRKVGEVILADSGSTDRTLAIATCYPIRVAQLSSARDRSCGIGPQLGFQYASGTFVCLIDGDTMLDPGFLDKASAFLAVNPRAAGVGGFVEEKNVLNLEFARRRKHSARDRKPGDVDRLNGGALYRREAIESVSYLSDRNLHAYEEFDLGVRLRAAGWTLHRLPVPFVDHYGHVIGAYRLLWRRFTTRYLYGVGEVVRGSVGRPHFTKTLTDLPEIRLWCAVYGGWLAAVIALLAAPTTSVMALILAALILCPIAAQSLRHRSLALGFYMFAAWNAHAIGMALGFMRPRVPPDAWIESSILNPAIVETEASADRAARAGGDNSQPAAQSTAPTVLAREDLRHV